MPHGCLNLIHSLFPKVIEIQQLIKFYDVDGDNHISYQEFAKGLQDPLSERKQKAVNTAFTTLDREGMGAIKIADLVRLFDGSHHPEVLSGKKTREQLLEEFLSFFHAVTGNITRQDWQDFYQDLALSVPSDESFVTIVETAWGLSEDELSSSFQDKVKQLIAMVRQRLRTLSNGTEEEYKLRQIFKLFDLNNSGTITIEELAAMLAKLGIQIDRKYIQGFLRALDLNNNGMIEFEEFATLVIYDPYK